MVENKEVEKKDYYLGYAGNDRLGREKEKIVSLVRVKGPSLPVQIAKGIGVESIFASAFLSELYGEKKLRMTNMRVGSSPLYYLEGQEAMLENFIEHLNPREKDAFLLLRREGVLADDAQEPVTRVALRAIRDFAVPVRAKANEDSKLFWKYFLLSDSDMKNIIRKILKIDEKAEESAGEPEESKAEEKKEEKAGELLQIEREKKLKKEKRKKLKAKDSQFSKKLREHIIAKDIELLETLFDKKKEFMARVRIDTLFGKQELLLVAKEKKTITNNDLTLALQRAQEHKMPAILMSSGELNKKAEEYLRNWRNLVRFEKLNF